MDTTQIIYALFALVVLLILGVLGYLYKSVSNMDRLQRQAIQEIGKKGKETIDRLDRKLSESAQLFETKMTALKEDVAKVGGKNYMALTNGFKESSQNSQQIIENNGRSSDRIVQEITATQEKLVETVALINQQMTGLKNTISALNKENVQKVDEALRHTNTSVLQVQKGLGSIDEKIRRLSTLEEIEVSFEEQENTNKSQK